MRQERGVLVMLGMLVATGMPVVGDAGPIPDQPFSQEYRDPFVRGKTSGENDIRAIAIDGGGRVWVATEAGLRTVESGALVEPPGQAVGGPTFDIATVGRVVWVGAWDGLYRCEGGTARRVDGPAGPVTLVAPRGGRFLVGNPEGLLERVAGQWRPLPGPWATSVRDVAMVGNDLYVASWSGLYRRHSKRVDRFAGPNQLLSRNLRGLAVGPRGRLYVGSRGGLDVYRNGSRDTFFTGRQGLPSTDVRVLAFDNDGRLWVGTSLGVARFDGHRWSLRHSRRWLPNDEVRDIAFGVDGAAWIATAGGVSVVRTRTMTLADKAAFFQRLVRARHVRPPGMVERCYLRVPGDLTTWGPMDTDNDGSYTGVYLVAEACRYAVTGAADAKANATNAYRAMEFLQTVTGTKGFVARTVVPADWTRMADPNRTETPQQQAEHKAADARRKYVATRWRPSADGKWLWKGDTSSDEITGHFFAYNYYYDLVADAREKARVARHVRRIIDFIVDGGYVLRDRDGKATRWGVWAPDKLNHDPNWWLERGCNSVEILSYLTVARSITGDEKYGREIGRLLHAHHYDRNILRPMQSRPDYFTYIGFELLAMSYPALLAHERDPMRRAVYRQSLERWFAPIRKDASPFYSFIYGAAGGGEFPRQACVEQLRNMPLDMIQWTVDNSRREDINLVERPVEGLVQTDRLLPPSERAVFRWDRNVYQAVRGDGGRVESSSVFWLAPYWMGRYYGFIGAPGDTVASKPKGQQGTRRDKMDQAIH